MSNYDRAAQFSPFAALTGFDDTIAESARLTDNRAELDECEIAQIDETLREICENIDARPLVTLTHFVSDAQKSGGAYVRTRGNVKKIDPLEGNVLLTDGSVVPISEIIRACVEK